MYTHTKNTKNIISKIHVFLIEKYFEDLRQDEEHVPDLVESIIQPPGLVKEELRPILSKMGQFGSEITKINVKLVGFRKSKVFPPEANANLLASKF